MKTIFSSLLALALLTPVVSEATCPPVTSSTACLTWTPPTKNTDGTDIAANAVITYTIYKSQTAPPAQVAGTTTAKEFVVTGLSAGLWYFAVTATVSGSQSALSNQVSKTFKVAAPTNGSIEDK